MGHISKLSIKSWDGFTTKCLSAVKDVETDLKDGHCSPTAVRK